jgi:PKD repeat protein
MNHPPLCTLRRALGCALFTPLLLGCIPGVLPEAEFSAGVVTGEAPLAVVLGDNSNPGAEYITSWEWDLGDGTTANTRVVNHVYQNVGKYTVSLTVSDSLGSDTETKTNFINVFRAPVPNFTASPTTGEAPLAVTFTNTSIPGSSPILSLFWNFGDGETSGDLQPTHTYDKPGTYDVYVYVIDENGARAIRKNNIVTVL